MRRGWVRKVEGGPGTAGLPPSGPLGYSQARAMGAGGEEVGPGWFLGQGEWSEEKPSPEEKEELGALGKGGWF